MPVDFNGPKAKVAFDQFLQPLVDADLARRADRVAALAAAGAPVASGDLQASIHKEKIAGGYKVIADASNGKSRYGYPVEVGHVARDGVTPVGAQPYMLPALEAAGDEY